MDSPISVRSEVGKLKAVLLHRPGVELENLMPDYLSHQLFDDIPYLVYAQQEHDSFACTLRLGASNCSVLQYGNLSHHAGGMSRAWISAAA